MTTTGSAGPSAAPFIKNKLFYFGNFEYNPLGQASQPGQTVYCAHGRRARAASTA